MATRRINMPTRPSQRPKLNTGGDESNLNDLVNFQLPPRRHNFAGPRRSKKTGATSTPWARERFVNSAYRFVLKPSVTADYTVHFADPDIYFQWVDIVQILVPHTSSSLSGEGNTMCPICLGPPIAPRMTKCGHVYCFACALHYLQTGEQAGWHRCPICFDSISEVGLKPVKWFYGFNDETLGTGSPGSMLKMRLMQRPQLTTLALPQSDTWPSELIPPHQAAFQFLPDIYRFAKFMLPTPESLQQDFSEEIDALKIDRDEKIGFADGIGASFVEGALAKVYRLVEDAKALDVPSLKDAISNTVRGMERAAAVAEKRSASARHADFTPGSGDGRPEGWAEHHEQYAPAPRELTATPTKQQRARRNLNPPPPSNSTYYFYQAASGATIFLHPLDIRILLSHFGSYDNFPRDIEVKAEARNEGTVDDDLRKRCKYLAHLPEAADVTFIEADLESVVGREVLSAFDGALKSRRARRRDKERKDDRAKVKAEERERDRLADEHWVLTFSAGRQVASTRTREDDELQAFLRGDVEDGRSSPRPRVQTEVAPPPSGAWGTRSFASTLSGPATGRTRPSASTTGETDGWDMDAAWQELEQSRNATGGGAGRKKKTAKLVLSLNGGGAPAGRRR